MPMLSMWQYQKGNNYKFMDNHVRQFFNVGGTPAFVHKYIGPISGDAPAKTYPDNSNPNTQLAGDTTQPVYENPTELDIQDLFYLENRDRNYSNDIYELRTHYTVSDSDFDLRQFGLMISTDNFNMTFHYNDMVERLGRALMTGDVIELPHLRQEQLDPNMPPINKFYVVQDAGRSAEGYGPHWHTHMWRIRVGPVNNQQEYYQILNKPAEDFYGDPTGQSLENVLSTYDTNIAIMNAVDEQANKLVSKRKFFHQNLYIMPSVDANGNLIPRDNDSYPICLAYGDGIPPNGAILVGSGNQFPDTPEEGDYYLRTDYSPNVLFIRKGGLWRREESNWRTNWSKANDVLKRFINDNGFMEYQDSGQDIKTRQYLSRVLRPDIE